MTLRTWLKHFFARKALRNRSQRRQRQPAWEQLEDRVQPAGIYSAIDGTGNNLANPALGSAGTDLIRIAPAAYANGISTPSGANRPNARLISNVLSDQTDPADPTQDLDRINTMGLSDFIYVFGQFLDHDLDLTVTNSSKSFNIPPGSATDPMGTEIFTRSLTDPATGTSASNPLQQINSVTSFLDGSQIYGSDPVRADALRTHVGGKLKTSTGNLLPLDNRGTFPSGTLTMANDAGIVANDKLFAAGDVRANENIELTAMQTLFVREHNRIAGILAKNHPAWNDETLYQESRRLVTAELQMITYNEWLPALLGSNALTAYTGYKSNVNPAISNEFSTAMFRFAHSQLDNEVGRVNNDGTESAAGEAELAMAFFNPTLINVSGAIDPFSGLAATDIGPILKSAASGNAQEVDLLAVRAVRNFLFGPPGAGGSDLIARDIQRGRDHGLTDYNSMRAAYGLPRVTNFAQITSNVAAQQKLRQLYGNVNNIDVFIGAIAEDHAPGADVGPLTKAVLVNQFTRLRDGDRFFYLNQQFTSDEQAIIQGTTLARVIRQDTPMTNLQNNVFFYRSSVSGTVFAQSTSGGQTVQSGLAGVTIELRDDTGAVLATTVTDRNGNYSFNYQNGMNGSGNYAIHLVVPSGYQATSADTRTVLIGRGDINLTGLNFTVRTARRTSSPLGQITPANLGTIDSALAPV